MNKALAVLLGVCLTTAASADNKDVSSEPSVIVYKIKAGDTVNKLARKHMVQPVDLDAIHKANHLQNIDLLPIGADLNIPRHLVKTNPSKAIIMGVSCATAIRLNNSNKPLTVGTHVSEGAVIEVPAECHVSLLLEDSSIIRLPSSAQLKITTLRKNALETAPEVKLDLARGRVELDVNKNRGKSTPFEIRTPLSIMGVRGTEFRVGYRPKIIGFDFLFLDPTTDDPELAKQMRRLNTVLPLEFSIQEDAKQSLKPTLPVKPLANAAGIGHINLSFDSDGVIRGINMMEQG
jgi:LysM repeat protein